MVDFLLTLSHPKEPKVLLDPPQRVKLCWRLARSVSPKLAIGMVIHLIGKSNIIGKDRGIRKKLLCGRNRSQRHHDGQIRSTPKAPWHITIIPCTLATVLHQDISCKCHLKDTKNLLAKDGVVPIGILMHHHPSPQRTTGLRGDKEAKIGTTLNRAIQSSCTEKCAKALTKKALETLAV